MSGKHQRPRRRVEAVGGVAALVTSFLVLPASPAQASSVVSASFSGGTGTASVAGVLYAKQSAAVTLDVTAPLGTRCVTVTGAANLGTKTSSTAQTSWQFSATAPAGNGAQAFTIAASADFNNNGKCTGNSTSTSASYTADNSGPVLTAAYASGTQTAPNADGWFNKNVDITWSASDQAGLKDGPTPAKGSQTANTTGADFTSSATDALGNVGTGKVTVKLDKTSPTVTAAQTPTANAAGWNNTDVTVNFTATASISGLKTAPGAVKLETSKLGHAATGKAVDGADNEGSATLSGINIDKVPPTLTGSATTVPNGSGWYAGDVTIAWAASDALSGLEGTAPAAGKLTGEGRDLKLSASVKDKAGNATSADSAPVHIDRTAPTTTITGTSNEWINGSVTVGLSASDALSGVSTTTYSVNGGAEQTGTSVTLSAEGEHTLSYGSSDKAGNAEARRTVRVRIDKSAPTMRHRFTPSAYEDGAWTNKNVTVSFECGDSLSGVESCPADVTVSGEGENQQVTGTGRDKAGNSANHTASVSIDKTGPVVTASADRAPDSNGWYNSNVTVRYSAQDALSGVASTSGDDVVGEGANGSADGSATDRAGNVGQAGLSGLKVDKTAPVLNAAFMSGWHSGDVVVRWTCEDALSGPASKLDDHVVTGEGANLASSADCADTAGNKATKSVDGIKIDRAAPVTQPVVPKPLKSGYYDGPVTVDLRAHDNLSGVAATYYTVNGVQATYTQPFVLTALDNLVTFWSVDNAGNIEPVGHNNTLHIQIDGNPPTTTLINPISPDSGWFVTSGIPFAFSAKDDESGVKATYYRIDGGDRQAYGQPFTSDLSDGRHTVTYWSVDNAGNIENARSAEINVDTVQPVITGSQTPVANGFGWNNAPVTVTFACRDEGSRIREVAGCTPDAVLENETGAAGVEVEGEAVDVAGNRATTTYGPVRIDTTAPTLSGEPTTAAGASGWYRGDVKVEWTANDTLSGVDPDTEPADSTISGEGRGLKAGPVAVSDKAGNSSGDTRSAAVKIDRTAPDVVGKVVTSDTDRSERTPVNGWYNSAVRVHFTVADPALQDGSAGSGVTQPEDQVLTGNGTDQKAEAEVRDAAGNSGKGVVDGINIDTLAPESSADNACGTNGTWCTGAAAQVALIAKDQAGLSGVAQIRFSVNGGEWASVTELEDVLGGKKAEISVPLDRASGAAEVAFRAVDVAGNFEKVNKASLVYDNVAPTLTSTRSPEANAAGWNRADTSVTFTARDDDKGSGVDASSVTCTGGAAGVKAADGSVRCVSAVTGETSATEITGKAKDVAGNAAVDSPVTVKIDRTKPTISASAIVGGQQYVAGTWTNKTVTVSFSCSDDRSGIPAGTCPAAVQTSTAGDHTVKGDVADLAGNSADTVSFGLIRIDTAGPTLHVTAKATYTLGEAAPSCTATDSASGIDGACRVTVNGGNANGVGSFTYTATATDKAGNTSTATGTYKVIYRFDGFLQPINDTAHQVGTSTSIFKAGSTIPAKFRLKKADGTVVQGGSAAWLTPVKGSAMTAAVDESVYTASTDSGTTYRYDATASQYIYNWKTPSAGGNYHRIGVTLDDGQTYYVNIGLR